MSVVHTHACTNTPAHAHVCTNTHTHTQHTTSKGSHSLCEHTDVFLGTSSFTTEKAALSSVLSFGSTLATAGVLVVERDCPHHFPPVIPGLRIWKEGRQGWRREGRREGGRGRREGWRREEWREWEREDSGMAAC